MADVDAALKDWSATSSSNKPTGGTTIGTGLDDNLREIQGSVVRNLHHKGADIASASTTDLGAVEGLMHDITGTTTITSFGTVREGVWKLIKFEGTLTLTHNATSLILPGAANIITANGDTALCFSEGSGNWRVHQYTRGGVNIAGGVISKNLADATGGVDTVSGLAFRPKKITFIGVVASTEQTLNVIAVGASVRGWASSASGNYQQSTSVIFGTSFGATEQSAALALTNDGFTLTWTKTGSPTGTATINYIAEG